MSIVQPQYPQHIKGVEFFSLTAALKNFRQEVEKGTGSPVQCVEINAALLIDDIAKFIGLGEKQRAEILGKSGAAFVASVEAEPIKIEPRH